MSRKLSRQKESLTLEEAAKYLSLLIGEDATPADLLELALQGDLTLSIKLVQTHPARLASKTPLQEATLFRNRLPKSDDDPSGGGRVEVLQGTEKQVFVDALLTKVAEMDRSTDGRTQEVAFLMRQVATDTAGDAEAEYAAAFDGDLLPDFSGVLEFDPGPVHPIVGIWDLSMKGAEAEEIKHRLHGETGGPQPRFPLMNLYGVLLYQRSTNRWAKLCDPFFDDDGQEVVFPCDHLPEGAPIVIRREELQRFADSLNEPETEQMATLPDDFRTLYVSIGAGELPQVDLLITAWRKFWKGRSPNDGKPYPKNAEVTAWVKSQMDKPSASMAEHIAKIIRPSWAPNHRQRTHDQ